MVGGAKWECPRGRGQPVQWGGAKEGGANPTKGVGLWLFEEGGRGKSERRGVAKPRRRVWGRGLVGVGVVITRPRPQESTTCASRPRDWRTTASGSARRGGGTELRGHGLHC